jgi:hypothetical protein
MLEEERRAAFAALPFRTRALIRLEQAAYAAAAVAFVGFLVWLKW